LDIQILKEVNAKNGKPHAEENGRGDGRLHGAVQTSPGLSDTRAESFHGLLPTGVLATKAGPRGGWSKPSHAQVAPRYFEPGAPWEPSEAR
jgi:hypothetical protein